MSSNIITLTAEQVGDLRGKGQAFFDNSRIRIMRESSGYTPLIAGDGSPCPDQIVLSNTDLDVLEQQPAAGLEVTDVGRTTGWTIRMSAAS